MRVGTLLVLLGLILMSFFFGWQAFGDIALFVLLLLAAALSLLAWSLYRIRRRMEQSVELAARMFGQAAGAPPGRQPGPADAIDVKGRVRRPRDGADDPDDLAAGPRP